MLICGNAGKILSPASRVQIPEDKLQMLLDLADHMQSITMTDYTVVAFSGIMSTFAHSRFINYHGQLVVDPHLQSRSNHSIYRSFDTPTGLLSEFLLSIPLLSMPYTLMASFSKLSVGSYILYISCHEFTREIRKKWQDFIVIATVLLTTNVAFLAIPSVDKNNDQRTPAQIASYVSIVMSMVCITTGGLLVHLIHTDVLSFAQHIWHFPVNGPDFVPLAVLYSIPYASLCWGFITFMLAFSLECFSTSNLATICLVAISLGLLAILVAWCMYVKSVKRAFSQSILSRLDDLMKKIFGRPQPRTTLAMLQRTPTATTV